MTIPKYIFIKKSENISVRVGPKTYHLNINSALLRGIIALYDASDFITSAKYY